jgi:flagellar basal-body rod modification protein FlgD
MSIGSVDSSTSVSQQQSLGMQDFLKVLLTQLSYQDPLKPMDNQTFMAQMAQFTTLQQTQELSDKLSTLITNQAALQSIGLIGRMVDVKTSTGQSLVGQVTALSLAGNTPAMTIATTNGSTVANIGLDQITGVR